MREGGLLSGRGRPQEQAVEAAAASPHCPSSLRPGGSKAVPPAAGPARKRCHEGPSPEGAVAMPQRAGWAHHAGFPYSRRFTDPWVGVSAAPGNARDALFGTTFTASPRRGLPARSRWGRRQRGGGELAFPGLLSGSSRPGRSRSTLGLETDSPSEHPQPPPLSIPSPGRSWYSLHGEASAGLGGG